MGFLSRLRYRLWTPTLLLQDQQTGECFYDVPWPRRVADWCVGAIRSGKALGYTVIAGVAGGAGWRLADYLIDKLGAGCS